MILSGPKACRGSMKEARIFAAFLHSPEEAVSWMAHKIAGERTSRGRYILLIEEGSGLCIPRGIFAALDGARDKQLEGRRSRGWGSRMG